MDTMQLRGCIRSGETKVSPISCIPFSGLQSQNSQISINLFENKNYQAILDRLDSGYSDAMALITSMKEYRTLQMQDIERLNSYSDKCISRLQHLLPLSGYATTMDAHLQTYQSFRLQTTIINERCNNVQQIIDRYSKQVDKTYRKAHFSITHKHCETENMKKAFKETRLPVCKVLETLENLRAKEKKARTAIQNRPVDIQNLTSASSTNEEKKIKEIQEDIVLAEEKLKKKQETYIQQATKIFQQCQKLEKDRLDQLNQALIEFIEQIHPSKYSTKLVEIHANLLLDIQNKQNTINDLNCCAQTYGVHTLMPTTAPKTITNENVNDSATNNLK